MSVAWLFSYGPSTDPEAIRPLLGGWDRLERAHLDDYAYRFAGEHPEMGGGVSTIVPMAGGRVIGVAYSVTQEAIDAAVAEAPHRVPRPFGIQVGEEEVEAVALVPAEEGELTAPAEAYLESVRAGLRGHYEEETVQRYLGHAVKQSGAEPVVNASFDSPDAYKFEYGTDFRRLFPWEATRSEPFGGAWALLHPEEATTAHSHDEEEVFIFASGEGVMSVDGKEFAVKQGDVVYMDPFSAHTVRNVGTEPIRMLCIWWGEVVQS